MGGNTALFLGALDPLVDFVCASGAPGSYRRKLARGIGLEMALIIPGFASRFDMDDCQRCIAPRPWDRVRNGRLRHRGRVGHR